MRRNRSRGDALPHGLNVTGFQASEKTAILAISPERGPVPISSVLLHWPRPRWPRIDICRGPRPGRGLRIGPRLDRKANRMVENFAELRTAQAWLGCGRYHARERKLRHSASWPGRAKWGQRNRAGVKAAHGRDNRCRGEKISCSPLFSRHRCVIVRFETSSI